MGIEKKVISFRFDNDLIQQLKHYAELENRSLSNFVETILKQELKELEKNNKNSKD